MINWRMHHPIIDLIGYSIVLSWAVMWGMVVGGMFEQEILRQQSQPVPIWYQLPTKDTVPSPDVFEGVG
jgi:hypothetical protein